MNQKSTHKTQVEEQNKLQYSESSPNTGPFLTYHWKQPQHRTLPHLPNAATILQGLLVITDNQHSDAQRASAKEPASTKHANHVWEYLHIWNAARGDQIKDGDRGNHTYVYWSRASSTLGQESSTHSNGPGPSKHSMRTLHTEHPVPYQLYHLLQMPSDLRPSWMRKANRKHIWRESWKLEMLGLHYFRKKSTMKQPPE